MPSPGCCCGCPGFIECFSTKTALEVTVSGLGGQPCCTGYNGIYLLPLDEDFIVDPCIIRIADGNDQSCYCNDPSEPIGKSWEIQLHLGIVGFPQWLFQFQFFENCSTFNNPRPIKTWTMNNVTHGLETLQGAFTTLCDGGTVVVPRGTDTHVCGSGFCRVRLV